MLTIYGLEKNLSFGGKRKARIAGPSSFTKHNLIKYSINKSNQVIQSSNPIK